MNYNNRTPKEKIQDLYVKMTKIEVLFKSWTKSEISEKEFSSSMSLAIDQACQDCANIVNDSNVGSTLMNVSSPRSGAIFLSLG